MTYGEFNHHEMMSEINDEIALKTRRGLLAQLSGNIPTEDLEIIAAEFPRVLDEALHEILNRRKPPQSVPAEIRDVPHCLAHWQPEPCIFCAHD